MSPDEYLDLRLLAGWSVRHAAAPGGLWNFTGLTDHEWAINREHLELGNRVALALLAEELWSQFDRQACAR